LKTITVVEIRKRAEVYVHRLRVASHAASSAHKENHMPKYLCQGFYTEEGLKGLLKEGGSKRRAMVEQLARDMGGQLEAFYFAFGSDDFYIVLDMPGNVDMTAAALVAQASGTVKSRITVLLTPEEVDQAVKKHVDFLAPGK